MSSPICATSCSGSLWILGLHPSCFAIGFPIAGSRRRRPSQTVRDVIARRPPRPPGSSAHPGKTSSPPAHHDRTSAPRPCRHSVCRCAVASSCRTGLDECLCHVSPPNGYGLNAQLLLQRKECWLAGLDGFVQIPAQLDFAEQRTDMLGALGPMPVFLARET